MPESPFPILSDVQVALQRLLNLLQVKTGGGFSLSSAIVPTVDVSALLAEEAGSSLVPVLAHDVFHEEAAGGHVEAAFGPTYTVPAGRSAIIEHVQARIQRLAAGGVGGLINLFGVIDRAQPRSGSALPYVFRLQLIDVNPGVVAVLKEFHYAPRFTLRAGDAFRMRATDLTGTVSPNMLIQASVSIIERPA